MILRKVWDCLSVCLRVNAPHFSLLKCKREKLALLNGPRVERKENNREAGIFKREKKQHGALTSQKVWIDPF